MAVLRTESVGWASSGVRVLSGEDEITQLTISILKGKGSFELDGDAFTIDSHGLLRAHAVLKKGSSVIARVKHIGFFGIERVKEVEDLLRDITGSQHAPRE